MCNKSPTPNYKLSQPESFGTALEVKIEMTDVSYMCTCFSTEMIMLIFQALTSDSYNFPLSCHLGARFFLVLAAQPLGPAEDKAKAAARAQHE